MESLPLPVQDAKSVTIELNKLNWELIDLTYRFEWDDPNWVGEIAGENEITNRKKAVQVWSDKRKQYMASISRRVKYRSATGKGGCERSPLAGFLSKLSTIWNQLPASMLTIEFDLQYLVGKFG